MQCHRFSRSLSLAAGRSSIALNISVPWGMIEKYLGWLRVDFFFEILLPSAPGGTVKAIEIIAYVYFTCFLWFRLRILQKKVVDWPRRKDWVRDCWLVTMLGVVPAILLCLIGATLAYFDTSNHGSTTRSIFSDDATATNSSDLGNAYDDEYQPRSGFFAGWLIRADPSSPCELRETNIFLASGIGFTILTCLVFFCCTIIIICVGSQGDRKSAMISSAVCVFALAFLFVCLIFFSAWEECTNGEVITTRHYAPTPVPTIINAPSPVPTIIMYDDTYLPRSGFFPGWLIRDDPTAECSLEEMNAFLTFGIIFCGFALCSIATVLRIMDDSMKEESYSFVGLRSLVCTLACTLLALVFSLGVEESVTTEKR